MYELKQWLGKTPVFGLLIIFFALPFVFQFLDIEIDRLAIEWAFPVLGGYVILVFYFREYLKEKRDGWYNVLLIVYGYVISAFPAFVLVSLDNRLRLGGLLWIPGIIIETALMIWLIIRYRKKRPTRLVYSTKEQIESSYPFENLCADLARGRRVEFMYNYERYAFIYENERYYFKRIIAINPDEYELLAEAGEALACIDASGVNGKTITGLWPDIEKITVYLQPVGKIQ